MLTINYQGQELPAQPIAQVSTYTDNGVETLLEHQGQHYLQRRLHSGPVFVHRVSPEGAELWQSAVREKADPSRKAAPPVVAAIGPIQLQIDVPPTANQCGVRYDIHLDAKHANTVRRAARRLGMPLNAFVQAVFNDELPVTIGFMPHEPCAALARAVERSIKRLEPGLHEDIKMRASYHGCSSMHAYLCQAFAQVHCNDIVVHPQTGLPVGTDRYWERIRELLSVDRPQWTTDPLDYPGFLDRYPNRDPWLSIEGGRAPMEEVCLRTPPVQLAAA